MKSFKQAIKKAKLPEHYSIHCARHTYATYLLHDTGNLRYVQKQLGHAQLAMTALYADVLPEENGKLANMIRRDEA
jgi:site-specific recombinase XerD